MKLDSSYKWNRKFNIFLILFIFLITSFSAHSADDTGQYLVMGLGNLSCKSFVKDDETGTAYYMSWLAGYMSAYNYLQEDTYSIVSKSKTVDQMESWLKDYCTVNGDETFERATRNLLSSLKYFRIKRNQ